MKTVVYDTKAYDRESLEPAGNGKIEWSFQPFRLDKDTADAARGATAVCVFVNDKADRPVLETLRSLGVKHIALRCAGVRASDFASGWVVRIVFMSPSLWIACEVGPVIRAL